MLMIFSCITIIFSAIGYAIEYNSFSIIRWSAMAVVLLLCNTYEKSNSECVVYK